MNAMMIIGIVFSLAGSLLIIIAAAIWVRTRQFVSKAQKAEGTVIRMDRDTEGATAPIFQFTTTTGLVVDVAEQIYSTPPQFSTGQKVTVLYDPDRPTQARISKPSNLFFVPLLMAGMGFAFGGIGIILVIFTILDTLS